jgi:hypothetical protein
MCMFCRSLFVLLYFLPLVIVLSVLLRYTDSDCPFVIFKLFFTLTYIYFPFVTILHARFYDNSKYRHVTDRCIFLAKKVKPFLNVSFGLTEFGRQIRKIRFVNCNYIWMCIINIKCSYLFSDNVMMFAFIIWRHRKTIISLTIDDVITKSI